MKKLFFILAVCLSVFASAQCPVVNLPQNAKWKFNFSQCFLDTTTHTYVTPAQVAYFDGNQNLTTIPFAQLADSIGVSGPNGNQWNIQYYDGGNFGSSTNFNFNGFNGVFYIYDVNGDTLFSVNVNTREIKGYGTFTGNIGNFDTLTANTFTDPTTYPDSSVLFVGSDGKPTTDSSRFLYGANGRYMFGSASGVMNTKNLSFTPGVYYIGTSTGNISKHTYSSTASAKNAFRFIRFAGSNTSPSAPTNTYEVGQLEFYSGYDTSGLFDYRYTFGNAVIGTPSSTFYNSAFVFTKGYGSGSGSTRLGSLPSAFNVYGNGMITVNPTSIADSLFGLTVNGTAAITQTPASTNGTDDIAVMDGSTGQVKTIPFEEGTYLPTDSGQTNFNTLTLNTANYSRVGKTVTVFGTFNMDPLTAGGTLTFFYLSLPIATNLPLNSSGGTFNGRSGERGTIYSDGNSSNRVLVSFLATTTSSTIASYSYSYTIQ